LLTEGKRQRYASDCADGWTKRIRRKQKVIAAYTEGKRWRCELESTDRYRGPNGYSQRDKEASRNVDAAKI